MMNKELRYIFKLIICLVTFFCSGYLLKFILKLVGISVSKLNGGWMMFIELILALLISGVVLIIYFKNLKDDYIVFKKNLNKNITYIIKMFIIFILVKYAVSVLSTLIIIVLGYDIESITSVNQSTIENYVKMYPWIMVFTTSVLAPLYEETLFRLGFKKVFKNNVLFILISGFIFGVMHVFPLSDGVDLLLGITQSISYVTMGIFLAYSYQKTNNIFTSIGIHFLNNFLSVLVMINMM